jgi:hypothetical protein
MLVIVRMIIYVSVEEDRRCKVLVNDGAVDVVIVDDDDVIISSSTRRNSNCNTSEPIFTSVLTLTPTTCEILCDGCD